MNEVTNAPLDIRFSNVYQASCYVVLYAVFCKDKKFGLQQEWLDEIEAGEDAQEYTGPFFVRFNTAIPVEAHYILYKLSIQIRSPLDVEEMNQRAEGNRIDFKPLEDEAYDDNTWKFLMGYGVKVAKEIGYTPYKDSTKQPCDLCGKLVWMGPEQSKHKAKGMKMLCETCCINLFGADVSNNMMPLTNKGAGE